MISLKLLPQFWMLALIMISVALGVLLYPLGNTSSKRKYLFFTIPFIGMFLLLSVSLYLFWGSSDLLIHNIAIQKINDSVENLKQEKGPEQQSLINTLNELSTQLDYSHAALGHLGNIFMMLSLYDHAAPLFEKALKMSPDNSQYVQQWIYADSLQHNGKLRTKTRESAINLLAKEPDLFSLVNLLAIDDFINERYQEAIKHWQRLLENDKELTPQRRTMLKNAILSAQSRLGEKPVMQDVQNLRFRVRVSVSDKLKPYVSANDTVYVFIKGVQGERMPLAVTKIKASELPTIVTLTEANAMISGMSISSHDKIQITAKVSKTGNPLDNKGELRGISGTIMVTSGDNNVDILINEQIG